MSSYFSRINKIQYEGANSTNPLSFKHYTPDEIVLGKTMKEHLRFASCYWHNFCWNGSDVFGAGTYGRPWLESGNAMERAMQKADVAFAIFRKTQYTLLLFSRH